MTRKLILTICIALTGILGSQVNAQSTQLALNYDEMDDEYSQNNGFTYYDYLWNINRNYTNDSFETLTFASVLYDTLINFDYTTGTYISTLPAPTSTVTVDSFQLYYVHNRTFTTSADEIYVGVYDIADASINGTGSSAVFSTTFLWEDSFKVSGSQNFNNQGVLQQTGVYELTLKPNVTLPEGHLFGVYVSFKGNIANSLSVVAGFRDECNMACGAAAAYAPDNSLYYINFISSGQNYSGIDPLGYSCSPCSDFVLQNFVFPAFVTVNSAAQTPPAVVTTAATSVTQTSATLNGTVNANGAESIPEFEYGLNNSYGSSAIGNPEFVTGNSVTAVNGTLTGLTPGTTYHYRIDATNTGGTSNGNDMTFTTLSSGSNACTPNPNVTSGLSPAAENVPCVVQGEDFSQTYTFVIPGIVDFEDNIIHVTSLTIDSVTNLPQNLSWSANSNPATFQPGSSGCYIISGITNGSCGEYLTNIIVNINTVELGELEGLNVAAAGIPLQFLRVIAPGKGCPSLDTSQTTSFVSYPTCGTGNSISASITSTTNVSCNGLSNGSATVTASGGSTYTYLWSNGQTTATISGLQANTYNVTVSSGGSSATASAIITQPAVLTSPQITAVNVSCNGAANGTVTVTGIPSGGTAPFAYSLNAGTYQSSTVFTGLAPGPYSVVAQDFHGCTSGSSNSVTITQPTVVTVSVSSTPASCSSNNGTATANGTGGANSFTYLWSNNQGGATISGLTPGTYTVTATDTKGCTASNIATVSSSATYTISVTGTAVGCYGQSSGQASVTTSGATGTITYLWSNGSTTASASGLAAGLVSVTVTDGSGCEQVGSVNITQPANALVATTTTTESTCSSSTGSATVTVSGNNGSITYMWNNGGTGSVISNLPAGLYSVTVTAGGCSATSSAAVGNTDGPQINFQVTNPTCFDGRNGLIHVHGTGADSSAYQYSWSTNASGPNLTELTAGIYSLTVNDQNTDCQAYQQITLSQPDSIIFNVTVNNVTCFGGQNGNIVLQAEGGSPPFSYEWSNHATTSTISNLSGGPYSITATDTNNCTAIANFTVVEPTAINVTVTPTASSGNNGTASITVSGGTPPYSYYWSNADTSAFITNLAAQIYQVTVSDRNGCSVTDSAAIVTGINDMLNFISTVSVFPNPANELLTVQVKIDRIRSLKLQITDITGKLIYDDVQTFNGSLNQQLNLTRYPAGVYILEVSTEQQFVRNRFVVTH